MALTSVSTRTTLNNANQQIVVEDITDYAAQGVPLDGTWPIGGRLRITLTSASGTSTVYDNLAGVNADIDPNVGPTNNIPISLPLDSNGNIRQGTYVVVYVMTGQDSVGNEINLSVSNTYDYDMTLPEVCLSVSINCVSSIVTSYDETDYGAYSTTIARVHTLYPPPTSPMAIVTGTTAVLNAGPNIYDSTWTQGVVTTVTYTFPDGLLAVLLLEGSREFGVTCDVGLGRIFCCLEKLQKRYDSALTQNPIRAAVMFEDTIEPTNQAMLMYKSALDAGASTSAAYWYAQIIARSGCGEDCGCSSDGPQQVYPALGSVGQFVVDSPDNSIAVIPTVVGNITTFHIQVSAAIQALISNLFSTTVSTNTPSYLDVILTGTGSNRNYEVNFIPTAVSGSNNMCVKRFVIDPTLNNTAHYLEFTQNDIVNQGALINNVGAQLVRLGSNNPNVSTDVAVFYIYNVLINVLDPYSVQTCVMRSESLGTVTNTKNIEAEVFYIGVGSSIIMIRLYNPQTGQPYTLGDLASGTFNSIYISFNLIA
jgi:hypothetical protein